MPHPAHSHPLKPDEWDMRRRPYHEYLRDIGEKPDYSIIPPIQPKSICDQCGNVVSTISLTMCPYCDYEVCGFAPCFHYCVDANLCAYTGCNNEVGRGVYCSRRCTGLGLSERYN